VDVSACLRLSRNNQPNRDVDRKISIGMTLYLQQPFDYRGGYGFHSSTNFFWQKMKNNLSVYGGEACKIKSLAVLIRYNSSFGFVLKSDEVIFIILNLFFSSSII